MKSEISINIGDLAELMEKADKALQTVMDLTNFDLFLDTPDSWENDKIARIKACAVRAANLKGGDLTARLTLAHECAMELRHVSYLVMSDYDLPRPKNPSPQELRDLMAKSDALRWANKFSDYE